MMHIMRNAAHNIRTAAKEASHERIVQAAARAIRRSGYDGTGVADIMKESLRTGSPFVFINDSGGARVQEGIGSLSGYGRVFHANVLLSGAVPQIYYRTQIQIDANNTPKKINSKLKTRVYNFNLQV